MQTKNSVSQTIIILHKIKKDILNRNVRLLKCFHFYTLNTWFGLLLHELLHQCGCDMEAVSLWHSSGVMEAQIALIVAFRSSALFGLVSLIFLLTIPHRFSMVIQVRQVCWPINHSNTMAIEPAFGTFGSVGRCQVLLENETSII